MLDSSYVQMTEDLKQEDGQEEPVGHIEVYGDEQRVHGNHNVENVSEKPANQAYNYHEEIFYDLNIKIYILRHQ